MTFRLGLAQCRHPQDGDVAAMVDEWAARAKAAGVDLLVFPESLMTPFELDDTAFGKAAQPLSGPFATAIDDVARKHGLWMVYTMNESGASPSLPDDSGMRGESDDNDDVGKRMRPFNTAVIVDDKGRKQAAYRKVHLFDTDFVLESDKVAPGSALLQPIRAPFGIIGIGICYDLRFPELARTAALAGCELLVYTSAWVDGPLKVRQWKTLLAARAIENEMFVVGLSRCDRAFGNARRDYAGHSCVFDPLGREIAAAAGTNEELVIADIDPSAIGTARAAMPVLSHRRPDVY